MIAVDDDPGKVAAVRERLDRMGLYGTRASVLVGDPVTYPFSPYLASLVVSETPDRLEPVGRTSAGPRRIPHPATVRRRRRCLGLAGGSQPDRADRARRSVSRCERSAGWRLRAAGPLGVAARERRTGRMRRPTRPAPGHRKTISSARRWPCCGSMRRSDGTSIPGQNQVRVVGGRLVLLEEGVLRASDVYTGRKLWEIEVPVGVKPLADPLAREAVRYAQTSAMGTAGEPRVDDAAGGRRGRDLPERTARVAWCSIRPRASRPDSIDLPDDLKTPWANLRVCGDYLVGSSGPHLLCVDRHTGKLLWRVEDDASPR